MNSTGLYDIKTHRDNKLRYYNATEEKNFLFTPAEFALIAIANSGSSCLAWSTIPRTDKKDTTNRFGVSIRTTLTKFSA